MAYYEGGKRKNYSSPCTGLDGPCVFQEAAAPRFQDIRHMKLARLSALRTSRFYPSENFLCTHFCQSLS